MDAGCEPPEVYIEAPVHGSGAEIVDAAHHAAPNVYDLEHCVAGVGECKPNGCTLTRGVGPGRCQRQGGRRVDRIDPDGRNPDPGRPNIPATGAPILPNCQRHSRGHRRHIRPRLVARGVADDGSFAGPAKRDRTCNVDRGGANVVATAEILLRPAQKQIVVERGVDEGSHAVGLSHHNTRGGPAGRDAPICEPAVDRELRDSEFTAE